MNRRDFIKSISATAILSSLGISCAQDARPDISGPMEGLGAAYLLAAQNLGVEESFRCTIGDMGAWDMSIRFADDCKTRISPCRSFEHEGKTMWSQNPEHLRAPYQVSIFTKTHNMSLEEFQKAEIALIMWKRSEFDDFMEERIMAEAVEGWMFSPPKSFKRFVRQVDSVTYTSSCS